MIEIGKYLLEVLIVSLTITVVISLYAAQKRKEADGANPVRTAWLWNIALVAAACFLVIWNFQTRF